GSGELLPGLSNFSALLIGLGVTWLLLGGVSLAVPQLASILSLAGFGFALWGWIWLLVIAFTDDVLKGVLFLFVPCGLYALYYIFTNLDTTGRPFLLYFLGCCMMATGSAIMAHAGIG